MKPIYFSEYILQLVNILCAMFNLLAFLYDKNNKIAVFSIRFKKKYAVLSVLKNVVPLVVYEFLDFVKICIKSYVCVKTIRKTTETYTFLRIFTNSKNSYSTKPINVYETKTINIFLFLCYRVKFKNLK